MTEISVGEPRRETPPEEALRLWFDEQEKKSLDNLEAGARQIITLVTTIYGLLFGALAFGSEKMEASLHYRPVLVPGTVAILAMLGAVIISLIRLRSLSLAASAPGFQARVTIGNIFGL
jgi:hypothetical protein